MWCTGSVHHMTTDWYRDILVVYIAWPQMDTVLLTRSDSPQPDRPRPTTLLPPRSNGKPEAAIAIDKLLMMGMRMPETIWAVFKRQTIKLRDWCIWLVDLFECMMMHGLTTPKSVLVWLIWWCGRICYEVLASVRGTTLKIIPNMCQNFKHSISSQ